MTQFLKEYGLISVLIFAAVGGYFLLGDEREDILASSLDAIGSRLTELVAEGDAKAQTANSFEAFKDAVAANEISPAEVERVAASVLNLSTSGAKLTQDEAKMVLDLAYQGEGGAFPIPDLSTGGPAPSTSGTSGETVARPTEPVTPAKKLPQVAARTWTAESSKRVGDRVAAMVTLTDRMKNMSAEEAKEFGNHIQFIVSDGLRVIVDSAVTPVWQNPEFRDVARQLEREKIVVWDRNLAEARRQRAERLKSDRDMLAKTRESADMIPPQDAEKIRALDQLFHLREMGLVVDGDSLHMRVRLDEILKDALKQVEIEINAAMEEASANLEKSEG